MAQVHPLTVNMINHVIGVTRKEYKNINWHNAELFVRPLLSMEKFIDAANDACGYCTDENGNTIPEFLDFALRVSVLSHYAEIELPEDAEKLYTLVYGSDLYDTVCAHANKAQIEALRRSVRDRLGLA